MATYRLTSDAQVHWPTGPAKVTVPVTCCPFATLDPLPRHSDLQHQMKALYTLDWRRTACPTASLHRESASSFIHMSKKEITADINAISTAEDSSSRSEPEAHLAVAPDSDSMPLAAPLSSLSVKPVCVVKNYHKIQADPRWCPQRHC